MSTLAPNAESATSVPSFARLVRVEFARLFARRFIRVMAALMVLGAALAMCVAFVTFSRVTASDLAQAIRQRDREIVDFTAEFKRCAKNLTPSQVDEQCGSVPTADEFPPDQFLQNRPFRPDQVADLSFGVGVFVALFGFVLGATFIGAEWSSKNLVAWLFWEPRRLRLMAAKLLALLSVALAVAAVAELVWFGAAHALLHYRGLPVSTLGRSAHGFWGRVVHEQIRAGLLVVPAVLLGFGLANLIRNTAAALGIAFAYFAVVEIGVRRFNPDWSPYLFTSNVGAWVQNGGTTVYGKEVFDRKLDFVTARPIHLSNLHGGIALLVYAAVVLIVSVLLFRRRDIS